MRKMETNIRHGKDSFGDRKKSVSEFRDCFFYLCILLLYFTFVFYLCTCTCVFVYVFLVD